MRENIVTSIRHYIGVIHITSLIHFMVMVLSITGWLVVGLPHDCHTAMDRHKVVLHEIKKYSYLQPSWRQQTSKSVEVPEPKPKPEIAKSKHKIKVYTHKGGKPISKTQLRSTIAAVATKLSTIPNDNESLHKLIFETATVESRLGADIHGSNGLGLLQITPTTAKCFIDRLKKHHPKTHKELMSLYDKDRSLRENLLYNVPFSIGMSMVIYWQRAKSDVLSANSMKDRARIWKKHYNTYKGKGTVKGYISSNQQA